jgi:uncharacterized protein (DUF488 family)
MRLYTIGFTQSTAERFFERLKLAGVRTVVDIRLNPHGQLAGFAKQEDLPYFLDRLAGGCGYRHLPALAPTKEILKDYRAGGDWDAYTARFERLMDERGVPHTLEQSDFEPGPAALLCSEAAPEQCHRRLVAERLRAHWGGVEIIHL